MRFGQVAATSQFYLYGRRNCTAIGYEKARAAVLKDGPDLLESADLSLVGKVAMVTGANSGVGFEVAQYLARRGAEVHLVCRSAKRGEEARQAMIAASGNSQVHLLVCDCSLEADVRAAWEKFSQGRAAPRLDVLVCNAGVLLNELTLTSERVEVTLACHLLFGTYLLGKLALPALEATAGGRLVVVSSGGMYNTKFPSWEAAASLEGEAGGEVEFSGNLAYAYAKRGQVLLCERWAEEHPSVKLVSCHPGWTATPAVDAAYGDMKRYLEPMRTPWQGADGIAWLCAVDAAALQSGAFYLDRKVGPKHIAGPFFTQGTYTKNTRAEVDAMMLRLDEWSTGRRPAAEAEAEALALRSPLKESASPVDVARFMGRWFVLAQIPTPFDRGASDSVEDYSWNQVEQRIEVAFGMKRRGSTAATTILQRAYLQNAPVNSRWALSPKLAGFYLPLALPYLLVDVDPEYSATIIGAPDRSLMYVMARTPAVDEAVLRGLLDKVRRLGHDMSKVELVAHEGAPPPKLGVLEFDVAATPPAASAVLAK